MEPVVFDRIKVSSGMPEMAEYFSLYSATEWNKGHQLSPGAFYRSLQGSWYMIGVYFEGRLVGFGRIISDGILHAHIVDLMVHPDFQGCGIGSMVLGLLVDQCRRVGIPNIRLFSEKGKTEFFVKNGFKVRMPDCSGMEYVLDENNEKPLHDAPNE